MDCKLHFLRCFVINSKIKCGIVRRVKPKILTDGTLQQMFIYVQILSLKSPNLKAVINGIEKFPMRHWLIDV